jgi:transcriptional repressor of cell division inhibition gene dicB
MIEFMKKQTVIKHFGGVVATAKALGIKHQAVSQWRDPIPEGSAYKAQVVSRGKLKVDPAVYG